MKSRLLSMFLTVVLLVSMLPMSASAADKNELRDMVTKQYDAYAASISQPNEHNLAVTRMLNHSLNYPNKALVLGEGDVFTAALLNAQLFRSYLIDALTAGIGHLQSSDAKKAIVGTTTLGWYDYACTYNVVQWRNDTKNPALEPFVGYFMEHVIYSDPINQNDRAMGMVVGSAGSYMHITEIESDHGEPAYRVDLTVYDNFDFNADYSEEENLGFDTSTAALITLLGGKFLNPFAWTLTVSFDVSLSRNPFADVEKTDWFSDSVLWAVEQGITKGKTETSFAPYDACTRAQVVTFLWAANGKPAPGNDENPFTDVPDDAWYTQAVLWAVENGITGGISEGKFGPDESCTRAQIVTFLYAAAGKPSVSGGSGFADVAEDAWYAAPVVWAAENSVTSGMGDGRFAPDDICNRAQVVTFLKKLYE